MTDTQLSETVMVDEGTRLDMEQPVYGCKSSRELNAGLVLAVLTLAVAFAALGWGVWALVTG